MPARVVDSLIPELLKFMSPDPYAQLQPNHRYFINSLYFDSAGLDCYYQKIFGMRTRKKVRVRTYDRIPRPDTTVFLEIKKKYDAVVIKDRIAVPFRECEQILFHHITDEKSMEGNADTLRELIWLLRYNGMVPQLMVWYEREPFISTNITLFVYAKHMTGIIRLPATIFLSIKAHPIYNPHYRNYSSVFLRGCSTFPCATLLS